MNAPTNLGERFIAAFEEAFRIHQLDLRKGTTIPYISHLMAVTALVLESGGDEDEAIAALLHDAAEDHGGQRRLDEIGARFGDRVAFLVHGLSDTLQEDRDSKEDWPVRKLRYLTHLREETDEGVLRISRADKLHNARALLRDYRLERDRLWDRFSAEPPQQLWYYESLATIFTSKLPGVLSRELAETVARLRDVSGVEPKAPDGASATSPE